MAVQSLVFFATSLDGFIARPDGGIDWLPSGSDTGDYRYRDFIATIDVFVMRRKTYELAGSFSQRPYGKLKIFVLSRGSSEAGETLSQTVTGTSARSKQLARLSAEGYRRAYVDGGKAIQGFLRAGLIGDMTITRISILLGEGIPLFGSTGRASPCGMLRRSPILTVSCRVGTSRGLRVDTAEGRDREARGGPWFAFQGFNLGYPQVTSRIRCP